MICRGAIPGAASEVGLAAADGEKAEACEGEQESAGLGNQHPFNVHLGRLGGSDSVTKRVVMGDHGVLPQEDRSSVIVNDEPA